MARNAARRPAPSPSKHRIGSLAIAHSKRALIGGERRAERRDDVGEAGLAHRDRVDIALDHDDRARIMRGLAGAVMIEQQRALVEERGLRRIEVFCLGAGLHRPPAEGDDAAGAIMDRKHHPVAEPVIRNGDVFPMDEQARFDHRLGANALRRERVAQHKALGRGIAEPKALLHRGPEAAIGEIAARFGADRLLEVRFEQARRHRHNVDQARALLVLDRLGLA